jgi:hypothetical protein
MHGSTLRLFLGLAVAAAGVSGCQVISASITSPSDWIAGSSESISGSVQGSSRASGSDVGRDLSAWEQDVRSYAQASAMEGRDETAFLRGLGRLGERHGVVHVQGEPGTREAARAGLADAGMSAADATRFLDAAGLGAAPSAAASGTGR